VNNTPQQTILQFKKTNPRKLTMHCMAGFGTSNIDTNTSQNLTTTKTFIYNCGSIFLHIMRALGRMSQTCELSGTTTDYFWKYQRDAFFNLHLLLYLDTTLRQLTKHVI